MPRTHRTYDGGFRQEAVNLLLGSGRPLKQVAAELGVSANSLRAWRDQALTLGGQPSAVDLSATPGASVRPEG